jgi:hypothetical protein
MKTSTAKWLSLLLLGLAVPSISSREIETILQTQDRQRKFVPDDFINSRKEGRKSAVRKPRRTYRLASKPAAAARSANFTQLGITIWRLRPARDGDSDRRALVREKKGATLAAERVESDGMFRKGDYVRLSVESPRSGYLYVIDRDLFADGTTGEPMLIFPWSGSDNQLFPGRLIDIPDQEDDPSYFTARLTGSNQVGELVTFLVTTKPLEVPIADKPSRIDPKDLIDWERSWGGLTEWYELENGAGELWTKVEQAAARKGSRRLTRDDPAPQTIYRVFPSDSRGMLVTLVLRYGK